ncbi:MAG TPA: hypothetical protein VM573_03785 [Actinomycetota bacterium]|nr:hypothetical protein [Actinomycetota bacterium]
MGPVLVGLAGSAILTADAAAAGVVMATFTVAVAGGLVLVTATSSRARLIGATARVKRAVGWLLVTAGVAILWS